MTTSTSVILPEKSTAILPDAPTARSGHVTGMELSSVLRRVERRLKDLKLSADAASRMAERPDAIRNMRRAVKEGRLGVNTATVADLAPVLKTSLGWLLEGRGGRDREAESADAKTVRLVGYVGAGAEAHYYAINQGDLDEINAPFGSGPDTVAVEVRGDSLGPLFDRWLVFYDDVRRPVTSDLMGRLCVVGLANDQILIKKLRPAGKKGRFRLLSAGEPPIDNVEVEWAAPVKIMVPR